MTATSKLILACFAVASATYAHATVIYDNIEATSSGVDQVLFRGPLFDSFTPTTSQSISGLELALGRFPGFGDTGILTVSLYSDSSTSPGTVISTLGTIADSTLPINQITNYTVPLLSEPTVTAGTRYWIGLSDTDNAFWSWSTNMTATGVPGEYWAYGGGVVEPNTNQGPYQMNLTGTSVPDVANTAALLALTAAVFTILIRKSLLNVVKV